MTCKHISQARIKLTTLIGELKDFGNTTVYEKSGPYIKSGSVKPYVNEHWFSYDYGANWETAEPPVISRGKLEEKINEIDELLNSCNCYANEKIGRENDNARKEDLIKSHEAERRVFNSQLEDIKKTYKEITDKQFALIESVREENVVVRKENSQLQHALGLSKAQVEQLEIRLGEKTNDLNENKQILEALRKSFQELLITNTRSETEVLVVRESLSWTRERLKKDDERVKSTESKLEIKDKKLEETQDSLINLRITYETEKSRLENELKESRKKIEKLQNNSEHSREELLKERLESKEEKIEEWVEEHKKHGVFLEQLKDLQRIYEVLIEARKNHNQKDIYNNERKITNLKQWLSNKGIKIKEAQKICRKCERLAEIRLELGFKTTASYATYSEYGNYGNSRGNRNWKNINSNFTHELVQEWQKYGFAYEQCADWINIHSAQDQEQDEAIKNFAYFAWLRDVKKVDSEWVLNEGNQQELKQEFDNWVNQQQYQAQQEVPPRF